MPEAIVKNVKARCEAGKLSRWMSQLKKKRGLSCDALGEAVASIVENSRKKKEAHKGGADDVEKYEFAPFSDFIITQEDLSDGIWLRIADPDSEIYKAGTRERVPVSDVAHLAAKDDWLGPLVGHIDHDPEQEVDLEVRAFAWDPENGVYIKLHAARDVLEKIKTKQYLPSPEIVAEKDWHDENGAVTTYVRTGLGLMKNKPPIGKTVGPAKPGPNAFYGGETMADDETKKEEKAPEEPKKEEEKPPEEPPKEEKKDDDPLAKLRAEDVEMLKKELLEARLQLKAAELEKVKEGDEKKRLEAELQEIREQQKKALMSKLDEATLSVFTDLGIDPEKLPEEELKRYVAMVKLNRGDFPAVKEDDKKVKREMVKVGPDVSRPKAEVESNIAFNKEQWKKYGMSV